MEQKTLTAVPTQIQMFICPVVGTAASVRAEEGTALGHSKNVLVAKSTYLIPT